MEGIPFATVEQLQSRLDWTMDEGEIRTAQGALEDLSSEARYYGRPWPVPQLAPPRVAQLVLKAAHRYMHNPSGVTASRAGDEALQYTDRGLESGAPEFTDKEIRQIQNLSGRSPGFGTFSLYSWNSSQVGSQDIYVQTDPGDKPFPLIAAEEAEYFG